MIDEVDLRELFSRNDLPTERLREASEEFGRRVNLISGIEEYIAYNFPGYILENINQDRHYRSALLQLVPKEFKEGGRVSNLYAIYNPHEIKLTDTLLIDPSSKVCIFYDDFGVAVEVYQGGDYKEESLLDKFEEYKWGFIMGFIGIALAFVFIKLDLFSKYPMNYKAGAIFMFFLAGCLSLSAPMRRYSWDRSKGEDDEMLEKGIISFSIYFILTLSANIYLWGTVSGTTKVFESQSGKKLEVKFGEGLYDYEAREIQE